MYVVLDILTWAGLVSQHVAWILMGPAAVLGLAVLWRLYRYVGVLEANARRRDEE